MLAFASLPEFPPRLETPAVKAGEDKVLFHIPVAHIQVPYPGLIHRWIAYLYSPHDTIDAPRKLFEIFLHISAMQDSDQILSSLSALVKGMLYPPKGTPEGQLSPSMSQTMDVTLELSVSQHLSITFAYSRLVTMFNTVDAHYRNSATIGVVDQVWEATVILCRRLLIYSLALCASRDFRS